MSLGLVDMARQLDYVREVQPNKGLRVEAIQHWSGGNSGDSWCMEFVWLCLDVTTKGRAPFDRLQACQDLHALAQAKGWLVERTAAQPGDLFLYVDDSGHAHHVGIVTSPQATAGIAGNTSADGTSSNGDGVHEHALTTTDAHVRIVRLPVAPSTPPT